MGQLVLVVSIICFTDGIWYHDATMYVMDNLNHVSTIAELVQITKIYTKRYKHHQPLKSKTGSGFSCTYFSLKNKLFQNSIQVESHFLN
jgi:hypothetical protein